MHGKLSAHTAKSPAPRSRIKGTNNLGHNPLKLQYLILCYSIKLYNLSNLCGKDVPRIFCLRVFLFFFLSFRTSALIVKARILLCNLASDNSYGGLECGSVYDEMHHNSWTPSWRQIGQPNGEKRKDFFFLKARSTVQRWLSACRTMPHTKNSKQASETTWCKVRWTECFALEGEGEYSNIRSKNASSKLITFTVYGTRCSRQSLSQTESTSIFFFKFGAVCKSLCY